jgi:hypothetical protein
MGWEHNTLICQLTMSEHGAATSQEAGTQGWTHDVSYKWILYHGC